ncbi:MAG: DUF3786 domain-containing protein [Nitrospirota bacterium]
MKHNDVISPGEEKAWEILKGLKPVDVCTRALVSYEKELNIYRLDSFGMDFYISPLKKEIKTQNPEGEVLLKKFSYFYIHSVLWYLINAKDIPLSGRLVKPDHIRGGEFFFRGSHRLPFDKLAERYSNNKAGFIRRGKDLSARILDYGDASLELLPLPRMPITLILWTDDEEFHPGVDLLFDSTCEIHLSIDIIWSAAMLTVLVML